METPTPAEISASNAASETCRPRWMLGIVTEPPIERPTGKVASSPADPENANPLVLDHDRPRSKLARNPFWGRMLLRKPSPSPGSMTTSTFVTPIESITSFFVAFSAIPALRLAPPTSNREPFDAPKMYAGPLPSGGVGRVAEMLPSTSDVEVPPLISTPCFPYAKTPTLAVRSDVKAQFPN